MGWRAAGWRRGPRSGPSSQPRSLSSLPRTASPRSAAVADPSHGSGAFVVRPAPEDEVASPSRSFAAVWPVGGGRSCWCPRRPRSGDRGGDRGGVRGAGRAVVGGDRRARYRRWLEILEGRYDVVVGTRPARVRAGGGSGAHRGLAGEPSGSSGGPRAVLPRARCRAAASPARAERSACSRRCVRRPRRTRSAIADVAPSTRRWPPVEVVRAGPEGRAPRLLRALRETHAGLHLLAAPRLRHRAGVPFLRPTRRRARRAAASCDRRRASCDASCARHRGRCAHCGATDFGLRRGGAERVEEWAASVAPVPVRRIASSGPGTTARDARRSWWVGPSRCAISGPGDLELVAILDADLAERRPGIAARERALATWMEAVGVGPAVGQGDRAGGSPERPGDPGAGARQPGSVPRGRGRASRRRRGSRSVPRCSGWRAPPRSRPSSPRIRPITMLGIVGRRPDGMLARARPRSRERARSHGPRAGGPRRRGEGRGGTAPLERRTVDPT